MLTNPLASLGIQGTRSLNLSKRVEFGLEGRTALLHPSLYLVKKSGECEKSKSCLEGGEHGHDDTATSSSAGSLAGPATLANLGFPANVAFTTVVCWFDFRGLDEHKQAVQIRAQFVLEPVETTQLIHSGCTCSSSQFRKLSLPPTIGTAMISGSS